MDMIRGGLTKERDYFANIFKNSENSHRCCIFCLEKQKRIDRKTINQLYDYVVTTIGNHGFGRVYIYE